MYNWSADIRNLDHYIKQRTHIMRRDFAKPVVDNKCPTMYMHMYMKLKRLQLIEDQGLMMQQDNRRMAEKILRQMVMKSQVDNHFDPKDNIDRMKERLKLRQKSLMVTTLQNAALLKRMQLYKSPYNRKDLEREYQRGRNIMIPGDRCDKNWFNPKLTVLRYELERAKVMARSRLYKAVAGPSKNHKKPKCKTCYEKDTDDDDESFYFEDQEGEDEDAVNPSALGQESQVDSMSSLTESNLEDPYQKLRKYFSKQYVSTSASSDSSVGSTSEKTALQESYRKLSKYFDNLNVSDDSASTIGSNAPFLPEIKTKTLDKNTPKKSTSGKNLVPSPPKTPPKGNSPKVSPKTSQSNLKEPTVVKKTDSEINIAVFGPKNKPLFAKDEEVIYKPKKTPLWSYDAMVKKDIYKSPTAMNMTSPKKQVIEVVMEEIDPSIVSSLKKTKERKSNNKVRFMTQSEGDTKEEITAPSSDVTAKPTTNDSAAPSDGTQEPEPAGLDPTAQSDGNKKSEEAVKPAGNNSTGGNEKSDAVAEHAEGDCKKEA